jgi:hypothetical protein
MIYPKIWSSSFYKRDLLRKVGVSKKIEKSIKPRKLKKKTEKTENRLKF